MKKKLLLVGFLGVRCLYGQTDVLISRIFYGLDPVSRSIQDVRTDLLKMPDFRDITARYIDTAAYNVSELYYGCTYDQGIVPQKADSVQIGYYTITETTIPGGIRKYQAFKLEYFYSNADSLNKACGYLKSLLGSSSLDTEAFEVIEPRFLRPSDGMQYRYKLNKKRHRVYMQRNAFAPAGYSLMIEYQKPYSLARKRRD